MLERTEAPEPSDAEPRLGLLVPVGCVNPIGTLA